MTSESTNDPPVLMCFPFLTLHRPCHIGGWSLLPLQEALKADWASEQFRDNARSMLDSIIYGVGHFCLVQPTLVARTDGGFIGVRPEDAERDALTATVAFGALIRNRPRHKSGQASWLVAENVDYWEMPVSDDNYLGLPTGRRYRVLIGDSWSGDNPIIGPSVLDDTRNHHVSIDEKIAAVLHRALSEESDCAKRLRTAIMFFVESWRNTSSVVGVSTLALDYSKIICAQRTALEALFPGSHPSKRPPANDRIITGVRELVQRMKDSIDQADDWAEYSDAIRPFFAMQRKSVGKHGPYADNGFDDLIRLFARIRHASVHEGDPLQAVIDETPEKTLRDTGEQVEMVLRDAISLSAEFGCV